MKQGEKYIITGLVKPIKSSLQGKILARNGDEATIISLLDDRAIVDCNNRRITVNKRNLCQP